MTQKQILRRGLSPSTRQNQFENVKVYAGLMSGELQVGIPKYQHTNSEGES